MKMLYKSWPLDIWIVSIPRFRVWYTGNQVLVISIHRLRIALCWRKLDA